MHAQAARASCVRVCISLGLHPWAVADFLDICVHTMPRIRTYARAHTHICVIIVRLSASTSEMSP
eukprot:NODE_3663_length_644_cov_132.186555_g2625_i0.p4 GENE.NODE_3663_length_644_cov_132.186555_g2625_i0~~NODE_3663_length_644_cov_132.186555_g2625_i0.p4  ORF type:complete len:65 (+),score=0.03 NODE_3663_length_644_cov_132.186555_g2625_i0:368-562(+)